MKIDGWAEPYFGVQIPLPEGGITLQTHSEEACVGRHCVVHNPSDHPLSTAPLNWRADRGLMERICPHGIGHPDPDDIAYKESIGRSGEGVHGCDGCC